MSADNSFFTSEELARRWSITVNTLEIWRMKGEGPRYFRLRKSKGSAIRYRLSDILAYENNNIIETQNGSEKHNRKKD